VLVLDLVMHAKLLQQKLQPRHHLAREFRGRQSAVAELRRGVSMVATARETCRGATARTAPWRRDWRGLPTAPAETVRSARANRPAAAAAGEIKVFGVGGAGLLDAH